MKKFPFLIFAAMLVGALPAAAQLLTAPEGSAATITESMEPPPVAAPVPASTPTPREALSTPDLGNAPLEITADNSLEWRRNEKTFIARGHALATRGDSSIAAATLTAHYDDSKGGMKISQVLAESDVVLTSKDTKAYGERADYDLDKGYAIMTGSDLKMVSPDQTVTAHEKFEYWVAQGKLTATGRTKVTRAQDTLEADAVSATMKDNEKKQRVLETLEANGNVVITTPSEIVTGQHGIYRAATNKAELTGGVKITRGPNVLTGERAEVDMTTNVSQIFGAPSQGGRVKGVFYPGSQKK